LSDEFIATTATDVVKLIPNASVGLTIKNNCKLYRVVDWASGIRTRSCGKDASAADSAGVAWCYPARSSESGPPISVQASTLFKLLCDRLVDESCPEEGRAAGLWKIFRNGKVFVDRKDVLLDESLKLREELRADTPDYTCFKSLTLRCAVVDAELEMLCDGAGTYPDAWDTFCLEVSTSRPVGRPRGGILHCRNRHCQTAYKGRMFKTLTMRYFSRACLS
jgi:hypothetical protein